MRDIVYTETVGGIIMMAIMKMQIYHVIISI